MNIDMQAREMVLAGNVTLTQGENVITGDRLVVDLKSGRATVESSSRVRMLLTPNARRN
jgi:lipopolysaccharide export system protein LptA